MDGDRFAPDPDAPSLSLVIPAYNEAERIVSTIETVTSFLALQPYASEVIIVDDGSSDGTADLARSALYGHPSARLVTIPHGGKAAALRAGMESATRDQVGFSDADLATPLRYLTELRTALDGSCDVAIGSREGIGASRIGEPIYRHVMGRVFNRFVRLALLPGIQDTQCGFKLFRRAALSDILQRARLYTESNPFDGPRVTAFDVELLVVARQRGYRLCSIPVAWVYGSRSKVQPARDTWHNVIDVLQIRINVWRGRYG